ncbi:MAG: hypothetical protein ABIH82_06595 [Candidatus Woesearchaeota archaeon]
MIKMIDFDEEVRSYTSYKDSSGKYRMITHYNDGSREEFIDGKHRAYSPMYLGVSQTMVETEYKLGYKIETVYCRTEIITIDDGMSRKHVWKEQVQIPRSHFFTPKIIED